MRRGREGSWETWEEAGELGGPAGTSEEEKRGSVVSLLWPG